MLRSLLAGSSPAHSGSPSRSRSRSHSFRIGFRRCTCLFTCLCIYLCLYNCLYTRPAGAAEAAPLSTSDHPPAAPKGGASGGGAPWNRSGGDTIETSIVIPSLPFHDTGGTCGAADDYDQACPWSDSTAPDLVYRYTPPEAEEVDISLCPSGYDTKLYVYAGTRRQVIACNDDACGSLGLQSQLTALALSADSTYYFVVDGFGSECGLYDFTMARHLPCAVICPAGAAPEGEPLCGPEYVDVTNGGCNAETPVFQELEVQDDGCAAVCGQSGSYTAGSAARRDTDWFQVMGTGQPATVQCTAGFPMQLLLIYGLDCASPQFISTLAEPCTPARLERVLEDGAQAWVWVGPQAGVDVPCGAPYLLQVCGIRSGPLPTARKSWGAIKSLYRRSQPGIR